MLWAWIVVGVVVTLGVVGWLVVRSRRRDDVGPISIVMLLREPRRFTESDVRGAVRRALHVDADVHAMDLDPTTRAFAVISEAFPLLSVVDSARTYLEAEDIEEAASGCEDPRLRSAILSHRAWISVDAMGFKRTPKPEQRAEIYQRVLTRVAAELFDEKGLALYAPAEKRFAPMTPGLCDRLREGRFGEVFGDDAMNEPIINVHGHDERFERAVETARKRLPEFILAFERFGPASSALLKAGFKHERGTEHMWGSVTSVTSAGIVVTIENRAANPGVPTKGESVTVPSEIVTDWMYVDEKGNLHGGFVERLLVK